MVVVAVNEQDAKLLAGEKEDGEEEGTAKHE